MQDKQPEESKISQIEKMSEDEVALNSNDEVMIVKAEIDDRADEITLTAQPEDTVTAEERLDIAVVLLSLHHVYYP